jgi:hypothetical protein
MLDWREKSGGWMVAMRRDMARDSDGRQDQFNASVGVSSFSLVLVCFITA